MGELVMVFVSSVCVWCHLGQDVRECGCMLCVDDLSGLPTFSAGF